MALGIDHTAETIIPPMQVDVKSSKNLRELMKNKFHERYAISQIFSDTFKTSMFIMFFDAIKSTGFDMNALEISLKEIAKALSKKSNLSGADDKILYLQHESTFDSIDVIKAMISDLDTKKEDFLSIDSTFFRKYDSISGSDDASQTAEFLFDAMRSLLELAYTNVSQDSSDSDAATYIVASDIGKTLDA